MLKLASLVTVEKLGFDPCCHNKIILRIFKISDRGFMMNQHLISFTKPKYEHQSHLDLQQDILFRTGILYLKIALPLIFKMAAWEPLEPLWAFSYDRYHTG